MTEMIEYLIQTDYNLEKKKEKSAFIERVGDKLRE